jgi:predicted acetyltransferase
MAFEIRAIRDDEIPQFRETVMTTFGSDAEADQGGTDQQRAIIQPGQAWAAFDGTTIVATAGTFNLDISMPGGDALPMAGLTMVTVRPSHRRRGLLRQLMQRHLDDARERGFAVSGLWASEATIYGRFGYGLAAYCESYDIVNAHALRVVDRTFDELEWLDEARARELLPAIYARATAARPGALRRTETWWRERRFAEHASARSGASKRRHVVARRDGDLVGYVAFRQRGKFEAGMPGGSVEIIELIAIDPRAEATLWRFALSVDLFPNVTYWNAPADDPLPWLVDDFRRIKRRRGDNLWLRIEDVPAALVRRTYSRDGVLNIGIGEITYELVVEAGRAHCNTSRKAADIRTDMQTLGTLYLGCAPSSLLARADKVRGDHKALLLADQMFATAQAPWCAEVF